MIDSETYWQKQDPILLSQLTEKTPTVKIFKQTMGLSMKNIYQIALKYGYSKPYSEFFKVYDKIARKIYKNAPLTTGLNQLIQNLLQRHFSLGLVSASPQKWIDYFLSRLPQPAIFQTIISINDSDLAAKPAPDGYLAAIKQLQVKPENTIILEDSIYGIQSAKKSGAYVICLTEHWPPNYSAPGADRYIKTLSELNL